MNLYCLSFNFKENSNLEDSKFVINFTKWLYKIKAKVPENPLRYTIIFQSSYPYYNLVEEFEKFLCKKKFNKKILYILTQIKESDEVGEYLFSGDFDEILLHNFQENIVEGIYKKK